MGKTGNKAPWDALSEAEIEAYALALDQSDRKELARELGRFLTSWAVLEQGVLIFLTRVAPSAKNIDFAMLISALDIYERLRVIQALTATVSMSAAWKDDVGKLVGYVTGKLRDKRNRLVHDTWLVEADGSFTQLNFVTRPAKGDQTLSVVDTTPVTAHEIREICARVTLAGLTVKRLVQELEAAREDDSRT